MNKFIKQATERIRERFPGRKSFYELDDLRETELDSFLVELLTDVLVRRLRDDLELPLTEWADMKASPIQHKWEDFLETAENHVRLPEYKITALVKEVVNRWYPLIVWPRTQIPKFLMGNSEQQERESLKAKVDRLPANRQLGWAVVRYMEKKDLETIGRQKCREVVQKIDERLISRFDRGDWVKSITPLFALADGPVPAELLASYFYNRGQTHWSSQLAEKEGAISKQQFEQWMHEMAHDTGSKESVEAADRRQEQDARVAHQADRETTDQSLAAQFETEETTSSAPQTADYEEEPRQSEKKSGPESDRKEEEPQPMWRRFAQQAEVEGEPGEESEPADELKEEAEPEEDEPQLNELFGQGNGDVGKQQIQDLQDYLSEHRDYIIREIFRGSRQAYKQAIRKLAACEDWKEAYPYVDRQVFDRNDVDLYSEPALFFTDLLQQYFMDRNQ